MTSSVFFNDMLEVLLDGGAHHDFVNNDGKTAMDVARTDEVRRILSERKTLEFKCIAAKAVKTSDFLILGWFPKHWKFYWYALRSCASMHSVSLQNKVEIHIPF